MFKLFGKKRGAAPAEQLAECQKRRDWAGLCRAYYALGTAAMDRGDRNHAQLWLHRADTIYSARDEVYDKVGEQLADDCSSRIGQLEDTHILYNDIPAQVEEKAEGLGDIRVRVWGLLSLARLAKLGNRLSVLPGCGSLARLDWAVDAVLNAFQAPPPEDVFNSLKDLSGALYELGDDPAFWGMGSEIAVPGGMPFQVFDLNGMMGVHLEIDAFLSGILDMACARLQGQEPPAPETGIITGALLPDYYVRTGAEQLEEVPPIKAELERIWSDYEFVCSGPSWEAVAERTANYKELDILS
mgnify:FL=1|nr:hypothetical protein [uncultured Oscillibacter sp.]